MSIETIAKEIVHDLAGESELAQTARVGRERDQGLLLDPASTVVGGLSLADRENVGEGGRDVSRFPGPLSRPGELPELAGRDSAAGERPDFQGIP